VLFAVVLGVFVGAGRDVGSRRGQGGAPHWTYDLEAVKTGVTLGASTPSGWSSQVMAVDLREVVAGDGGAYQAPGLIWVHASGRVGAATR
jgi:hypothetical protein